MALSAKQERFVAEYAIDYNATQAAIRAGYSPSRAAVTACELMKKPEVIEAVKVTKRKQLALAEVTAADVRRRAWEIAQQDAHDRVPALNLLAKLFPEFSRSDGSGDTHQHLHLHGLSEDELRRLASGERA